GDLSDLGRGEAGAELAAELGQLRAGQSRLEGAEQSDRLALPGEGRSRRPPRVGKLSDHADHRGRIDGAVRALVAEGGVAADDRDAELLAGIGETGDGALELPGGRRLLRVAEVEAVG